jgi:hypothetical protein
MHAHRDLVADMQQGWHEAKAFECRCFVLYCGLLSTEWILRTTIAIELRCSAIQQLL